MEKKKHHRHLLRPRFLLATAVTILLTLSPAASQTDSGDSAVMLTLFKTLGSNKNLGWSNSGDPCSSWNHVRCDGNRVIAIQIGNLNLTGSLPPSLANLTKLQRLEVMENQISGPLPTLKGLGDLQFLLIHNNFFSSIPPDFFDGLTGLVAASLDHNPFPPWMIPDGLTSSSQLQNFSAVSANVTGKMPDFFAGFTSLENLALAFNSLEGGLPASLGSLSTIRSLWLNSQSNGGLSGSIDVVQNMTSLEQVWLHSNSFSGPLPDFSGLTSLKDLQLRDNDFTGPVPSSLRSLKSLKVVKLANNKFQGDFPLFDKSVAVDIDNESFCLPTPGECDVYVNIMLSIAKSFDYPDVFASNWKGNDPCSSWLGVGCDSSGNITVINFNSKGLNGMISRDFSLIPSLETLVLSKNNIKGTIPEVLTNLKNLKRLDLSNNNLYGNVPAFSQNVVVNTSGNPDIGKDHSSASPPGSSPPGGGESNSTGPGNSTDSSNGSSSVSVGVIVGSVIGGVCIVFVIGFLIFCFYKRKQHTFSRVQSPSTTVIHPRHSGSDPDLVKITTVAGSSLAGGTGSVSEAYSQTSSGPSDLHVVEGGNMVISIQVLRNVTNNFSSENILGRGGFGTVYKGELHDGTKIAVKRMESGVMGSKGLTEFKSEIAVLTKVRHRHLVSLLGYCLDGNERLLVYEYMPQGTLSRHLFNWKDEGLMPLEWKKRLSIVLDVARGVEYLHTLAHQSFIHRDLKPSNILLGDDMKAKVADFGLVRLAPDGKCSVETRLAGTFGYLAPEYAVTGRVTTKADVFSFGVILMELITGRKALDESQPEESVHLVTWFRRMQINKDTFRKAIDPAMDLDEETLASVSTVSELAGHCCAREPYQRPDMGHAVNVLSSLSEMWKPTDPDLEESYGIDLDLTLPQALKKWQAFEGNSQSDIATSSCPPSLDNTQTSIPTRPTGFADSFTSADGR